MIVELSLLVKCNARITVNIFKDYARFILDKSLKLTEDCNRVDVITDQYFKGSLKLEVRNNRGRGSRKVFNGTTTFPINFDSDFLFNDDNKNDLYNFLADYIISTYVGSKIIVVTKGNSVISNDSLTYG